jgi:ABC-type transport system involved in cytochrome bd biosynthesis fused ATPase/permease subunit
VPDEPTANLDPQTESVLLDAVYELMQGRATLVITHRLVRMEEMDEILVLTRDVSWNATPTRSSRAGAACTVRC